MKTGAILRESRVRCVRLAAALARGLGNVELDQSLVIAQALQWCEDGMDFADALHRASSHSAKKFATFDERMKKDAQPEAKPAIELL